MRCVSRVRLHLEVYNNTCLPGNLDVVPGRVRRTGRHHTSVLPVFENKLFNGNSKDTPSPRTRLHNISVPCTGSFLPTHLPQCYIHTHICVSINIRVLSKFACMHSHRTCRQTFTCSMTWAFFLLVWTVPLERHPCNMCFLLELQPLHQGCKLEASYRVTFHPPRRKIHG